MNCPICKLELQNFNEEIAKHLVVFKGVNNSKHVHGPIGNKDLMKEFINEILIHSGLSDNFKEVISTIKDRKEIVFHNRQRLGDILMFTSGVRDFKKTFPDIRVNVISTAGHIWDNNPYIDRTLIPTEQNTIKIGPGWLTNASNRLDWHFANAFRISIQDALNIHVPQGEPRPDIWFTEEEFNAPRVFKNPYWIIVLNGEKGWGCKMYPFERWQEFITQNKDITFVQLGTNEDNPPRLQGGNVIDYVGKTQDRDTGIRDLFKIFLNAEGSIGLVSFHMHLSGALYKPAIVIAGAREPVSFTRYQGHQYLATEGCLPCAAISACWHCNIDTCTNLVIGKEKVPKCVDIIYSEDITKALSMYYLGGRLQKGVVSKKPEFKNIVKTPVKVVIPEKPEKVKDRDLQNKDEELKKFRAQFGFQFDSGSIHSKDWEFVEKVIEENNVKTVLEFGCGLSTLLLLKKGIKVVSYDTTQRWIDKVKAINPQTDIRLWDGVNLDFKEKVDLVFIDGPSGGKMREFSTKIASELSDLVLVHDAYGADEKNWSEKYIKDKFEEPIKGGHWNGTYLWKRKASHSGGDINPSPSRSSPTIKKFINELLILSAGSSDIFKHELLEGKSISTSSGRPDTMRAPRSIKFVSTARGWGGCARSITTIMKYLLKAGHKVEFIPFRNSVGSHEFRDCLNSTLKDVKVTLDYETLHEACDILFIYADDYIWEFSKPEIAEKFSCLNAEKKIMMLNYRRGGVGEIEWTKNFDKFMFLNSIQEKELLKVLPNVKTKVLPPCTELDEFLKIQPNYNDNLRLVRHSSQGDTKFAKDFEIDIAQIIIARTDVEIHLLPGPSFYNANDIVFKYPRTDKPEVIAEFLSKGNLFWYSLPQGYMDMGPRVVVEALACGLPILADNWGGVVDRVTSECSWLCDKKEQFAEIIKGLSFEELKKKGQAARERAIQEFIPERWIDEILK